MDERGGGPVHLWVGFFVFLVMLLFAVQLLFNLYATSVVTSISFDTAPHVAGSDGGIRTPPSTPRPDARRSLGRYAQTGRLRLGWDQPG